MIIRNKFFYGYWIVLAGMVILTLNAGFAFFGFSVFNKPIADEFGWSRGEVTVAFSIFIITAAILSPIVGWLTDKRGPRQVLFLGTIVLPLALFLLSRTSALWNYYLFHLCLGIGHVLLQTIPLSIIISNWFHRLRGTMQGLAFTGIGLGGIVLAAPIGNYLIPNIGWSNTYLVMALFLLFIMLPLLLFIVKNHPYQKGLHPYGQEVAEVADGHGSKAKEITGLSLKEATGTLTFWVIALTSMVYGASLTAALQNQVSILTEQGFTATSAVAAIGIVGLGSAVGKLIFGYLCDRINPKYAAAISYALTASSLIIMIQARSMAHLWLFAVIHGLGHGGWAPNLAMLAASYFGLKQYGTVLGTIHLLYMTGLAIGPMVAGFAYDQTGSYHLVLTVFAILCFVSIPLIAVIRKPKIVSD